METIKEITKGNGAGGLNTTKYGKKFENKTNNEIRLLDKGFIKKLLNDNKKYNYYLYKIFDDRTELFFIQNSFKSFVKDKYNIDIYRIPDEAYIIEYNDNRKIIKILEKKEQHVEGSVETKLWGGPSLKREYELVFGEDFKIYYGFCINSFLQKKILSDNKKYINLNIILKESNIDILFGDDIDYYNNLDKWIEN